MFKTRVDDPAAHQRDLGARPHVAIRTFPAPTAQRPRAGRPSPNSGRPRNVGEGETRPVRSGQEQIPGLIREMDRVCTLVRVYTK